MSRADPYYRPPPPPYPQNRLRPSSEMWENYDDWYVPGFGYVNCDRNEWLQKYHMPPRAYVASMGYTPEYVKRLLSRWSNPLLRSTRNWEFQFSVPKEGIRYPLRVPIIKRAWNSVFEKTPLQIYYQMDMEEFHKCFYDFIQAFKVYYMFKNGIKLPHGIPIPIQNAFTALTVFGNNLSKSEYDDFIYWVNYIFNGWKEYPYDKIRFTREIDDRDLAETNFERPNTIIPPPLLEPRLRMNSRYNLRMIPTPNNEDADSYFY